MDPEVLETARGPIALLGRATPGLLSRLPLDPGLGAFGRYSSGAPDRQGRLLQRVAALPEGRVLVGVQVGRTVAFLAFHPADEAVRWGWEPFPELVELGGVEVSRAYRGLGIARGLLARAFTGGSYDDRIVYATGYTWCWDLEGSGLSAAAYRVRLLTLFKPFGFAEQGTDEPNIRFDGSNVLMARVGPGVPRTAHERFLTLLFDRSTARAA